MPGGDAALLAPLHRSAPVGAADWAAGLGGVRLAADDHLCGGRGTAPAAHPARLPAAAGQAAQGGWVRRGCRTGNRWCMPSKNRRQAVGEHANYTPVAQHQPRSQPSLSCRSAGGTTRRCAPPLPRCWRGCATCGAPTSSSWWAHWCPPPLLAGKQLCRRVQVAGQAPAAARQAAQQARGGVSFQC